jgi:hypothetical protein
MLSKKPQNLAIYKITKPVSVIIWSLFSITLYRPNSDCQEYRKSRTSG